MILVDTNVISEPLRKTPEPCVVAWINVEPLETLYLSSLTAAVLRFGVASFATRDIAPFEAAGVAVSIPGRRDDSGDLWAYWLAA